MPDFLAGTNNASMYGASTTGGGSGNPTPTSLGGGPSTAPSSTNSPAQGPGGDPSAGPGGDPTQGTATTADSALQSMVGLRMGQGPSPITPLPAPPTPTATDPNTGLTNGDTSGLLGIAKSFLGVPYLYGGTTPAGFDCSGYTQYVYQKAYGMDIGRDTGAQWQHGQLVGQQGNLQASLAQAQPGDLIFYGADGAGGPNAHVAIYAGNGKMYDAPHTGAQVELTNVWQGDGSEPFKGIRRYVSANTPASQATSVGYTGGPINTPQDFAAALLRGLGDPVTQANINSITAWEQREGGNWHNTATFNPLNTTLNDGAPSMNSVGVRQYANWAEGLKETEDTLTKSSFYQDILAALKAGNGLSHGQYAGLGKWSGGGYTSL